MIIQKMTYIQKLLNHFGFVEINSKVSKEDFEQKYNKITDIINDSFRQTFGMKKEQVDYLIKKKKVENEINNTTNKKILGFINTLIGEWGLEIKGYEIKLTNKDTKKRHKIWNYELNIIDIINNIKKRDREYELIN